MKWMKRFIKSKTSFRVFVVDKYLQILECTNLTYDIFVIANF